MTQQLAGRWCVPGFDRAPPRRWRRLFRIRPASPARASRRRSRLTPKQNSSDGKPIARAHREHSSTGTCANCSIVKSAHAVLLRRQHSRDSVQLMRKLLKKYAFVPERFVTDDLRSYGAAARALGLEHACMSAGDGGTIGPKIRISRPDDGSARCNVSRALALRRNSFQPTPPFTTLSTSNAISYQLNRTACSASRR